jgi:PIN domain nuclease of toxin-antitoxin system
MGTVTYLLDTCTFLWLAQQPSQISAAAAGAIDDPANDLGVSEVSLMEVVLKHAAGKLPLPDAPRVWIPAKLDFHQLQLLSLTPEVIYRCGELPKVHADPFDRLLAAHAIEVGMPVLSPDWSLSLLGASRIW